MRGATQVSIEGWRERLLLSFEQAASLLNVSVRNVYRLVASGQLQKAKVGRRAAVTVASLIAYYGRITGGGGAVC
jgi:excisionase family DNA binding protein